MDQRSFNGRIISALFSLLLWNSWAFAQPIINNGNQIADFSAAIPASDQKNVSADGPCTWAITPAGGPFSTGISPNTQATSITLTYTPVNGSPECNTFENYSLTATAGGLSSSAPIRGCRVPTPANFALDIELVIDVSGSMFEDAICACIQPSRAGSECIAETTNLNKLEYLKGKLAQFYQDIKPAMDNNTKNRLGLVVFSENAREEIPLTYFDVAGVSLLDAQIAAKMGSGGLQPETSTAMGKGLDLAIQKLDATPPGGEYNRHKVILLMTNGMQNEDPEVKKLPNGNVIIDKATPVVLNGAGIKIIPYAIFTPEGEYLDLLKSLGQAAGVTDVGLSTAPYVCRVTPDIESGWVSSLESMDSPKQIVHKNGRLNGMNGQETFNIQEGMDMLTIRIGSMGAGNYHAFKVEKLDGGVWKDITGFGDVIPQLSGGSSPFRVYNVSFPILKPGAPAVMEGEYRVTFSADRADWVYEMSVIVDDKGLKQDFFVTPFIRAGEPMLLGTRLRQSGNPVVDAKVKAILYQPKKRLSNSFAAKKVPGQFIDVKGPWGKFLSLKGIRPATHGSNDVSSSGGAYMDLKSWEGGYIKQISIDDPGLKSFQREGAKMENGEKKYLVLLHETNFREVYEQDIIAEIPLTHVGDGVYRAQYAGTQKAGLYHVRMEAEGNHPTIGAYRRFEEKTPVVIFGTPDRKKSCLFVLYESPLMLMMKPVDTQGNLLGPNELNAISIDLSDGSALQPVDYLDGRYVVPINLGSNPDPNMVIRIHDRLLYNGPLSGIQQKRGFFSLHGGLTFPKGDFGNFFERGYYAEGKLGLRVYRQWGLQAKGGYYAFKNSESGKTDYSIFGIGGGVTFRQWLGFNFLTGVYVQAEANAGYYKPESVDGVFGWNGGVCLIKPLNHFLNLVVSTDYYNLNTKPEKTRFLNAGLGLQLRF